MNYTRSPRWVINKQHSVSMCKWILGGVALWLLGACGGSESTGPPPPSTAVVLETTAPDSLLSASQLIPFSAVVQDSSGIENVTSVILTLRRGDEVLEAGTLTLQETIAADRAQFGASFDSTFAAGKKVGYSLEFHAVDVENRTSNILTEQIYLQNEPPRLSNPTTPDTLQRETGVPIQVRLTVTDPQGVTDFNSIYFTFQKPDGSFGGEEESEGGFHFLLFDDGNPDIGDREANDGLFSWRFPIVADALLGTYIFFFFALDEVGHVSTLSKNLELIPLER